MEFQILLKKKYFTLSHLVVRSTKKVWILSWIYLTVVRAIRESSFSYQ